MIIGFIGGNGHHYLRDLIGKNGITAAFAGDGHDDPAAVALAAKFPGSAYYPTAAEMLAKERLDIASVGAVYGFNGEQIALCLERGLPTVSDKPIAATWVQLQRIELLCQRGGRIITEFDARARREFRAARAAVARGAVGTIALVTCQKSYRWGTRPKWYTDRASYGSTLLWVASHGFDYVRFVTGQRLTRVTARQANVTRPEFGSAEDHVVAMLELSGGGSGLVHADFLRPAAAASHGDDRCRVMGSTGQIEIRGPQCLLTTAAAPETDIAANEPEMDVSQALFDAVRGKSEDLFSTSESLTMARILLQCRDAADEQATRTFNKRV